jgi:hypothetical protein
MPMSHKKNNRYLSKDTTSMLLSMDFGFCLDNNSFSWVIVEIPASN